MKKITFDEQNLSEFLRVGKVLIFCLLLLVEVIVAVNNRTLVTVGISALWVIIPTEVALAAENAIKMWGVKNFKQKIACYVFDVLFLLVLTYFTSGGLISTLYVIILTEFYFSQEKLSGSIAMGVCSVVLFLVVFAVSNALKSQEVDIGSIVAGSFNDLIIFVMHFFIVNFTLQICRKNIEIKKTVDELNEANEKLIKANAELKAVTALEERQRIAKDIDGVLEESSITVDTHHLTSLGEYVAALCFAESIGISTADVITNPEADVPAVSGDVTGWPELMIAFFAEHGLRIHDGEVRG